VGFIFFDDSSLGKQNFKIEDPAFNKSLLSYSGSSDKRLPSSTAS
jgi:hypothetical protein